MAKLKAPFPWFGGKSRAADIVWDRFGDVDSYNEPFAGSLAVLLARPNEAKVETVNDVDCYIANFWRALRAASDEVAYWADYPVNETDLHSRHRWLVAQTDFQDRMKSDPDYFDAKIAGWWVWGQCLWIGSGWCQRPEWEGRGVGAAKDRGIHTKRFKTNHKGTNGGVHRRWQGGGQGGGSGVHSPSLTTPQQKPDLSGDAGASGRGVHAKQWQQRPKLHGHGDETGLARATCSGIYSYLGELAVRLRRVRVCCGDWKRVLTPSVTTYIGVTGVLLDPPYAHDMRERCYSEDHDISDDVRQWAIDNGDNPDLRIALCGYDGEHEMPDDWKCVAWKAHGGYSRTERGKSNRERERIWFSPHCLAPAEPELPFRIA